MKSVSWTEGRQGSGYFKMLLGESRIPLPFDIYLLKFPKGSEIVEHTDPIKEGKRHYRFNIVLKKAKEGGIFRIDSAISKRRVFLNTPRLHFFRPDVDKHHVTKVESGTRYVLSIGWLR